MPRPPIDLSRKIVEILEHVGPMHEEADAPLAHFRASLGQHWTLIDYLEKKINETSSYLAVGNRHLARLNSMVLVNLIESFERFLKEIAAVCIDQLAELIADDRLKGFSLHGGMPAAHFQAPSIGRALCEAQTWLDCEDVTRRFRKLLADPFEDGNFTLFPPKAAETRTMKIVWQLRHSIVHNVGGLTRSDAAKLGALARCVIQADRVLLPTRKDLQYMKRFLDETADDCNRRTGRRLAELLTSIHQTAPLFDAVAKADELGTLFRIPLEVAGKVGNPSPLGP